MYCCPQNFACYVVASWVRPDNVKQAKRASLRCRYGTNGSGLFYSDFYLSEMKTNMRIDWQCIDHVFLDMDGTLLDLHFDNHFWQKVLPLEYARINSLTFEAAVASLIPMFEAKQGQLDWYCVEYWSRELNIDVMNLKYGNPQKIALRPGVFELLDDIKIRVAAPALLTNAHRSVVNLKLDKTGLGRAIDKVHCSHDYGYPKEAPTFWSRFAEIVEFDPERTLFIDDSEAVLEAADQFGIKWLRSISEPDSQQPRSSRSRFPEIDKFPEIFR